MHHSLEDPKPFLLSALAVISSTLAAAVIAPTAHAAAPTVVRTTPSDGDFDVDPRLTRIRIEFDQNMSSSGRSICGGGDGFPKLVGQPDWESARVFVMNVKLKPNHDYRFNVNCPGAMNFRGTSGKSSTPYSINFSTRGGKSDIKPAQHLESYKELRRLIDDSYSYRDIRDVNWDALFKKFKRPLCGAATPEQFGRYAGRMLAAAHDVHISVKHRDRWFTSFRRMVPPNANDKTLSKLVPGFAKRSGAVFSGRYPDGIGYILITSWRSRLADAMEAAYRELETLADGKGLIIDVRFNSGGSETLAQEFAGCFVDKPVLYAKHAYRDKNQDTGFSPPSERVLQPATNRPKYRGKIAVLTGPVVMSSCEAFLLMMKQVPRCALVGETSYGSSGNPKSYELPNGVTVKLPSWKTMWPDGRTWEGEGIPPDVTVVAKPEDFKNGDPVVEAALKYLRK